MRIFFVVALAGAWWAWHLHAQPQAKAAPAEPPAVAAGAPEHRGDPVVHCVFEADDSTFVRRSECAARGGEVDEPSWARQD
jgi:hypothetical protein